MGIPKLNNTCVPKSGHVTRNHNSEFLMSLPVIFIEMYTLQLTLIPLMLTIYDLFHK
jgi:hypothetical protein